MQSGSIYTSKYAGALAPIEQHDSLESTECAAAQTVAKLALDLLVDEQFTARSVPAACFPRPSRNCLEHLQTFNSKLTTLSDMHSIGLCHGKVDSEHFFSPSSRSGKCAWIHADTTAFHEGDAFEQNSLKDIVEAGLDHLCGAHAQAILEDVPIVSNIEKQVDLINNASDETNPDLIKQLQKLTQEAIGTLEQAELNPDDMGPHRSNKWIEGMNAEVKYELTEFTHPSNPEYPVVKQWEFPKVDTESIRALHRQIDSEALAWTHFVDNNNICITRAAFNPTT